MKRILTFHGKDSVGGEIRLGPVYYMEAEYTPVAVRIHAGRPPTATAKFDIFDDGVSIFNNRTQLQQNQTSGRDISGVAVTEVFLDPNQNSEEHAEDFNDNIIEVGSWVYCTLKEDGGGGNYTVHLELEKISDEGEQLE